MESDEGVYLYIQHNLQAAALLHNMGNITHSHLKSWAIAATCYIVDTCFRCALATYMGGTLSIYIYILLRQSMKIWPYIYIYHHTVQVAMCAYSFVRTLVNALVLQ